MKMDHATFAFYRDAFLDGRLTEEESRLVERHLAECSTSQACIDHLLAAEAHLRNKPEPKWTEELTQSVLDQTTSPLARHVWSWQLATAAGWLLAIGLGVMLLRPTQSPDQKVPSNEYYQPAAWMKSTLGPHRKVEDPSPVMEIVRHLRTGQTPSPRLLEAVARERQGSFGENRVILLEAEAACAHLIQPTGIDLEMLFPGLKSRLEALIQRQRPPDV